MNYIKNKTLFVNPLIVNGRKIFNPSEEQLFVAGYKKYIPCGVDYEKLDCYDCSPDYEETGDEVRLIYHYTFSKAKAQKHYCKLAQEMMDEKARERNYDGIMSVCSYATSSFPRFRAEAAACVVWRDAVWAKCYELLEAVLSGEMDIPSEEAFLALLPVMDWPDELGEGGNDGQTA